MSKTPASNTEQNNDITQGPFLGSESYDTGSSTGQLTTCSCVCCYHIVQEYRKGNHAEKAGDVNSIDGQILNRITHTYLKTKSHKYSTHTPQIQTISKNPRGKKQHLIG